MRSSAWSIIPRIAFITAVALAASGPWPVLLAMATLVIALQLLLAGMGRLAMRVYLAGALAVLLLLPMPLLLFPKG